VPPHPHMNPWAFFLMHSPPPARHQHPHGRLFFSGGGGREQGGDAAGSEEDISVGARRHHGSARPTLHPPDAYPTPPRPAPFPTISEQSSQCSCPSDGHTHNHPTPILASAPPPFPVPSPHLLRTSIQCPGVDFAPRRYLQEERSSPRPHPLGSFNCSAPARHHPRQPPASPPSRGYDIDSPAATDGSPSPLRTPVPTSPLAACFNPLSQSRERSHARAAIDPATLRRRRRGEKEVAEDATRGLWHDLDAERASAETISRSGH
jgi:hypothetical protein